ncbi:hypothetical protein LPB41_05255 [Thalassospira sp. MA62]|nr:hypothetical protein [Thalassospira sp. MA62]
MATIAYKDITSIEREVRSNWFANFINALQVALIMKASQAKSHKELMADLNKAWHQVEG